jgi:hypothetical protein
MPEHINMRDIPDQPFACTRQIMLNDLLAMYGTLVNARALIEALAGKEQIDASVAVNALSFFIRPLELELKRRLEERDVQ